MSDKMGTPPAEDETSPDSMRSLFEEFIKTSDEEEIRHLYQYLSNKPEWEPPTAPEMVAQEEKRKEYIEKVDLERYAYDGPTQSVYWMVRDFAKAASVFDEKDSEQFKVSHGESSCLKKRKSRDSNDYQAKRVRFDDGNASVYRCVCDIKACKRRDGGACILLETIQPAVCDIIPAPMLSAPTKIIELSHAFRRISNLYFPNKALQMSAFYRPGPFSRKIR
ncbi:hypothetical protein QBC44DRAFT_364683 [Cladorrhinum sp. PSN332]|nr:hypothetical protein QBC44DRAFT_364683 [Cladorrhinum sp. PSN332]